jgi:pyruvate,water dikinase
VKFILFPEEIDVSSPVGGKARALAELSQAELKVPAWFVILPEAFYASLTPEQDAALKSAQNAEAIRSIVDTVIPSAAVAREVQQAVAAICERGELAVRSSALGEDSAAHSFAGQLESFLFVTPNQVSAYVARVWRSGFGERLIAYRKEAGLPLAPGPPAVVVQRVVEGEASGVAFSADPVSGSRGIAVVAAVPGLASSLVSGATNGDTWRVDRNGRVVEANIAVKQLAQRHAPHAPDGVVTIALDREAATRPVLQENQALEVAELARKAEKFFGRPQDIEWTWSKGELYLLQSRPITGLADKVDPDGFRAIWDNSNIAESYGGITTPFTFSFARRAYEHVYRQFYRLMWIDQDRIEALNNIFCCMLGLVRGRVYYNLLNWYRLVALLPGYSFNRKFLDEMLGVRENSADENALASGQQLSTSERIRDGFRLMMTMLRLVFAYMGLNRRIQRFYGRVNETLGSGGPDLSRLRIEELTADYRQIEQRLLTHWDAPVINDLATMIFFGVLRRLVAAWIGDPQGTLQNDLLCAERGMISKEPAERVRRMAEIAAASPELVGLLCRGSLAAIRKQMRNNEDFAREFNDYLEKFGDRCMEELKLESSTLVDDPLPLLRSVGQLAPTLGKHVWAVEPDVEVQLRRAAEKRVREALAPHPIKRIIFARVLAAARARVRDRENLRFERTRVFGRARRITIEIGKRFAALDRLDDCRDIFYVEVDEMLAFVEGRATTTDLKGLVTIRKLEFDRYRSEPPPADRFETRGVVYVGNTCQLEAAYVPPTGESLKGIGCCAGIVRGRVRIICDPRRATVTSGEIIVAQRTDPGWVMIFPAAAGLLVEHGSLLSHSAIVAREMGLPAIVSLSGLTDWLKDGDWVEMDGSSGVVTKIQPPGPLESETSRGCERG